MNIDTISSPEEEENKFHEIQKAKWREYNNRPEVKARHKIHNSSFRVKDYKKKYWKKHEVKERKNESYREPKNKERILNQSQLRYYLQRTIKESEEESVNDIMNQIERDIRIEEGFAKDSMI